jgi:hypothetical protein
MGIILFKAALSDVCGFAEGDLVYPDSSMKMGRNENGTVLFY